MKQYKLVLLLLGICGFPVTDPMLTLEAQVTTIAATTNRNSSYDPNTTTTALDKPLITIAGLCDKSSDDEAKASGCETVITRAQFERLINAVQPNMPSRGRREFAERYADALVLAKKAEQIGLDKGPNYEEQIKIARIQILSQDIKKMIQEKASQISDQDVEDYYHHNAARFERALVDRIYIPRTRQLPSSSNSKLDDGDRQKTPQESEQTMKEEANRLRERAIAGEGFTKLQADAYQFAGIKSSAPNTSLEIRRISLPPTQASVMDLKPGEISQVFNDANGYFVYKIRTKETLSLDQTREEIKATLRSQRMKDEMQGIQNSATSTLDESYFVR